MISHRHRCIFVHVPKAGGSSIEDVIWGPEKGRAEADLWGAHERNRHQPDGLQHLLASQIREEVGLDVFCSYFKFAFVRNPFDKAVSQYEYLRQKRKVLRRRIGMADDASFAEYIKLIQEHPHPHWEPQHRFLFSGGGELLVDFVGRFERFETDARRVFDMLGIGVRLGPWRSTRVPHSRKGHRRPYDEYYDDETREAVRAMYARDLELFGYAF